MKKYLILFIIVTAVLFSIYGLAESAANNERLLVGFWGDAFPASSQVYGYFFFEDNTYIYWDQHLYNIEKRYDGSIGKWKLDNHKISILPEKDFYWEKDWISHDILGYIEGNDNKLYTKNSVYSNWVQIGDIRSYTEAKVYEEKGRKFFLKPENIMLNIIINGKITEFPRSYWKLRFKPLEDTSFRHLIEKYRELSK